MYCFLHHVHHAYISVEAVTALGNRIIEEIKASEPREGETFFTACLELLSGSGLWACSIIV